MQALLGLVVFGTFFGVFYLTESLASAAVAVVFVFVAAFIIALFIRQARMERLRRSGISDIDKMSGREFEHYLGQLLKAHGYSVNVTKAAGDFGADLIISKDGRKTVVQAKRYSKNVGIKAVQEAQASIAHYGASEAWVISNSGYTEAAISLARSNNVKLIDREQLIEMSLKMNAANKAAPNNQDKQSQSPPQLQQQEGHVSCDRCGSPMVLRNGSRGEFWGCSSFPKCRNIITDQKEVRTM